MKPNTPKLACPSCGSYASKVIRSLTTLSGFERWRRCQDCQRKFPTLETYRPLKTLIQNSTSC